MSGGLFFLSFANIFSLYSEIFQEIIKDEQVKRKKYGSLPKDIIFLPSDDEWNGRVYYRLLEFQKKINLALDSGM